MSEAGPNPKYNEEIDMVSVKQAAIYGKFAHLSGQCSAHIVGGSSVNVTFDTNDGASEFVELMKRADALYNNREYEPKPKTKSFLERLQDSIDAGDK